MLRHVLRAGGFAAALACLLAGLLPTAARAEPAAAATDAKPKRPPIASEAKRPLLPPTLTSGLRVPPGETFHLGERETGDFIVSAYNEGKTPVRILARRGKRRELVGEVKPNEKVVRAFKTGDGVLVENPSKNVKARLYVEVWGTRNLAMYYVPNEDEPPVESAPVGE
ncbi:MAG: hypothetical protein AAGB00_13390 [Planctomycetota bacterium]